MSALTAAQSGDTTTTPFFSGLDDPWIVVVLLIGAFALGWLPVGWLTWRWRYEQATSSHVADLEGRAARAETDARKVWDERDRLRRVLGGLAAEHSGLRYRIDQLRAEGVESSGRTVNLEAELAGSLSRVAVLEEEVDRLNSSSDSESTSDGDSDGAPTTDDGDHDEGHHPGMASSASLSVLPRAPARTDDLQVIKGIGPEMAEVLRGLDITAWEQVAALTSDDVDRIVEAVGGEVGRVDREAWVTQAKELVERFPDPIRRPA